MNYLKNKKVYLAGPIQHQEGGNWRTKVVEELTTMFGFEVFDPHADAKQQWWDTLKVADTNEDYDTIQRIAKDFCHKDLGIIDRQDCLIANLPYKVPTCGTYHEIISANTLKKPVLLVCEQGKTKVPFWLYGFIKHQMMFGSWADLYAYLKEVNDGLHKDNRRWAFTYGLV